MPTNTTYSPSLEVVLDIRFHFSCHIERGVCVLTASAQLGECTSHTLALQQQFLNFWLWVDDINFWAVQLLSKLTSIS